MQLKTGKRKLGPRAQSLGKLGAGDRCCIDKSSSAELSEAINSMYRWYNNAKVCYAYLVDVPDDTDARKKDSAFQKSRWFTRGWTLQELLAPRDFVFYSKGWVELGRKEALRERIAETTQIDKTALIFCDLRSFSVAQKIAWASNRVTTRGEDAAYSLLGIVGVNMLLLYGEGSEKAFLRLQEEIMKYSDDQSLFAWFDSSHEDSAAMGLIAKSPWEFRNCSSIVPVRTWETSEPYNMTNMGLRIKLSL
ncbi:HET-domain-containing protein, partial [Zopfia rhizophila CBS 207.26]